MAAVSFYVDGFNLYHAINGLHRPQLKWLNLRELAISFLEKQDTLAGVTYFTARMVWKPQNFRGIVNTSMQVIAHDVAVLSPNF